jgi:GT2 family glycosyltransferase
MESAADQRQVKVAVGYVHPDAGRVSSFEDSLVRLFNFDLMNAGLITERLAVRCGTSGLVAARNEVAARMLNTDCDWLLWVDTDMGFLPESLYQLLSVAHPVDRPIVGGLCFIQRQFGPDGYNGYRTRPMTTLFDWKPGDDGVPRFTAVPLYPVNSVVQVAATGSAFLLVHRSVFEKIAEEHGPTWYERTVGADGVLLGEDVSFCVRAATVGVPVHVHTGVRTTHYKAQWLSETDHWMRLNPPPATDEVAVLVPVLDRWRNAAPFMRSLRASTGLAQPAPRSSSPKKFPSPTR